MPPGEFSMQRRHPGSVGFGRRAGDVEHRVTLTRGFYIGRYEVTLEGPGHLVPGGNRLFARVDLQEIETVTLSDDAMHTKIEGIGFCETGQRNPTCMAIPSSDFFGVADPERHKEALAFLREEVCKAK